MRHTSIKKESGAIQSTEDLPITYDMYLPSNAVASLPVVIFIHGFKGFKDWGAFPDACFEIARSGCAVIAMNFSRNGVEGHNDTFDRLDLFQDETFTQDLADIRSVIDALQSQKIKSNSTTLETDYIALIGHSRGGHTAVTAAAEFNEVSTLITWAAVADYTKHFPPEMIKDWEKKGYTEIKNSRTGQLMRVNKSVYDDLLENADLLVAVKRVQSLMIPCCFIHGTLDKAVPMNNSQMLFQMCRSAEKERIMINGADHTFGISHPWVEDDISEHFSTVVEKTIEWLETYFLRHNM
ncbi:MAG: dienelactone hydrolase family protein [Balneolales bacterium]|nr:dienelactone hydrolase family protein [Balneolales bacterium]